MKIIIDIPEVTANEIKDNAMFAKEIASSVKWDITSAIVNGTPLNEVLDKIRDVISCNIIEDDTSGNTPTRLRADWDAANKAHMIDMAIIDKYKAESEVQDADSN